MSAFMDSSELTCTSRKAEPIMSTWPPTSSYESAPLSPSFTSGPPAPNYTPSPSPPYSPYSGMYDDAGQSAQSAGANMTPMGPAPTAPNMTPVPLNYSPSNATPEQQQQLAKAKEAAEKAKDVAIVQGYIDASKKLEADAATLQATGDQKAADAKRAEAAAQKQAAIDKAITTYKIDTSNAASIKYDSSTSGEADTNPTKDNKKGIVTVGDDAFSSAAWLGSSLGHETEGHINKQLMKGNWYTKEIGTDIQEVEAYQYELDNADRYGTSKAEIKKLAKRRKSHYEALPAEYKTVVDSGSYEMKKGDENK